MSKNIYNDPLFNPLFKKNKSKKLLKKITQEEINIAIDKFLKQGGTITQLESPSKNSDFTFATSSIKGQINKNLDPL